jgi:hypothetical protein
MAKFRAKKTKVGDLRPSQLITTFGIGCVIDLPHISTMVMGLDDWPVHATEEIGEERLLASVRALLGDQVKELRCPPIPEETNQFASNPFDAEARIGVPVAPFPRWMLCPMCRLLAPLSAGLFELKTDPFNPDRTRYVHHCHTGRGSPTVIPARFIVACPNGHIDDFPWIEFVHGGAKTCTGSLRLYELGTSGEAADVWVKCDKCDESRRMLYAFGEEGSANMPHCNARRPHLRNRDEGGCNVEHVKAMLQGASNTWFSVLLSALSVPMAAQKIDQLVEENWVKLEKVKSKDVLDYARATGDLKDFVSYSDDEIWGAVEKKREGTDASAEASDIKTPEWMVFTKPDPTFASRDFLLREVDPPADYSQFFEKIVLAERLREVRALVGFTRIESPGDFGEPYEIPKEQLVHLSRSAPTWVPTSEVRGEGIFFQFSEDAVSQWEAETKRKIHNDEFFEAHRAWRAARRLEPDANYPSLRYVLLHSFAHALIQQLAIECGYTAASIRERIYSATEADGEPMAGVLLYTAAPDSEGTLGGLVSLGQPKELVRHLDQAFEAMRLCASDPLCSEHRPTRQALTLHGAACHACLFVPETSCERGNKYLDRSVLVKTMERDDLAFFEP